MNDNLPSLSSAILTFIAAFAGALALGVLRWMSDDVRSSIIRGIHRVLSVILWPFRWVVTEFKEWRRVSVYKHRLITWDDLPLESKFNVHFRDLHELVQGFISWDDLPQASKDNVQFQDLSELARASIEVKDLPRDQKITLLDKFIFPRLQDAQHVGTLSLFDDNGSVELNETAQVGVAQGLDRRAVSQDRMRMTLNIAFTNPGSDFQLPMRRKIGFSEGSWAVLGTIDNRNRINPTTQTVVVWVTVLIFEDLAVYSSPTR